MNIEHAPRMAILISGGGSTMETIIKASQTGVLRERVNPVLVISSREDAGGIQKVNDLNKDHDNPIPVKVVQRSEYNSRDAFGVRINQLLDEYGVDVVSQNGWLPWTPENVVQAYEDRIFNQHPGPLDPEHLGADGKPLHFGGKGMHGLAVHAAVLEFQNKAQRNFPTEATIHKVTAGVDEGAVVYRRKVEVFEEDTPEKLAARVLPHEHQIQLIFWQMFVQNIVTPEVRKSPLIQQFEVIFLQDALEAARVAYPNG